MILTDDEIKAIDPDGLAEGFARVIESAVLGKLKAQKPFGYYENGRFSVTAGGGSDKWREHKGVVYTNPLPPDDVVRDAERYRWLRSANWFATRIIHEAPYGRTSHDSWEHLDATIDAAMKEMK